MQHVRLLCRWGREDDNMRERLMKLGRWPPQKPEVDRKKGRRFYYKHLAHPKAPEVSADNGLVF